MWLLPSGSDQVGECTVRPTPGAAYGDMRDKGQESDEVAGYIHPLVKDADDHKRFILQASEDSVASRPFSQISPPF